MPYLEPKLLQDPSVMPRIADWAVETKSVKFTWTAWAGNSTKSFTQLASHGFLPMTMDMDPIPGYRQQSVNDEATVGEGTQPLDNFKSVLLGKFHHHRCVLSLRPVPSPTLENTSCHPLQTLKISKATIRRASKYFFTVDACFDAVITCLRGQHEHCWLTPPYLRTIQPLFQSSTVLPLSKMFQNGTSKKSSSKSQSKLKSKSSSSTSSEETIGEKNNNDGLEIHTMEVWRWEIISSQGGTSEKDTCTELKLVLAGGEIGYFVNGIYTSLSGFTLESGAGSVQLACTGAYLQAQSWGQQGESKENNNNHSTKSDFTETSSTKTSSTGTVSTGTVSAQMHPRQSYSTQSMNCTSDSLPVVNDIPCVCLWDLGMSMPYKLDLGAISCTDKAHWQMIHRDCTRWYKKTKIQYTLASLKKAKRLEGTKIAKTTIKTNNNNEKNQDTKTTGKTTLLLSQTSDMKNSLPLPNKLLHEIKVKSLTRDQSNGTSHETNLTVNLTVPSLTFFEI
eukprot:g2302.t1